MEGLPSWAFPGHRATASRSGSEEVEWGSLGHWAFGARAALRAVVTSLSSLGNSDGLARSRRAPEGQTVCRSLAVRQLLIGNKFRMLMYPCVYELTRYNNSSFRAAFL